MSVPVEIKKMKLDLYRKYDDNVQIAKEIDFLNSNLKSFLDKSFIHTNSKIKNRENDSCALPKTSNNLKNNDTNFKEDRKYVDLIESKSINNLNLSRFSKNNIGYEIIKLGMQLLKQTNGNISNSEAVIELKKSFPEKSTDSLRTEIGKIRQNFNHIVLNDKSKKGVVYEIISQLRAGKTASAGISSTTNRYSTLAWRAFHEI